MLAYSPFMFLRLYVGKTVLLGQKKKKHLKSCVSR